MASSAFLFSTSAWTSRPRSPASSRRSPHRRPVCTAPLMKLDLGTRVRVNRYIIMYHYPGKKNVPVDVHGFVGVIIRDKSVTDGVQMTATAPYVVDFTPDHPKFKAHLEESELDVLDE